MKISKKILIIFIIIYFIFSNYVFARYNYEFEINAFSLKRDISEITYKTKKSTEDYTNKDVVMEINFNKEIEPVLGFELSEDNKTLTKTFTENETNILNIYDYSGNKKEMTYEINNIDKIPPEIIGVENNKTYNSNLRLNYKDNIGIKDIKIERYGTRLEFTCYTEYYDTSVYKGIDVTKNSILVWINEKPKNTIKYKYYINNNLKYEGANVEYKFTGLTPATAYNIKVEAIDKNGTVLGTMSKSITTTYFEELIAQKNGERFDIKLTGLDNAVKKVIVTQLSNSDRNKIKYIGTKINSDRSVVSGFSATDITKTLETGYYYLQFHMKDDYDNTIQLVNCNIIFNTNYEKKSQVLDPYNITINGNYEIIAYDLAGNETKKEFILKK